MVILDIIKIGAVILLGVVFWLVLVVSVLNQIDAKEVQDE